MKKKIVIFGSGVHAKVIFHSIINNDHFKFFHDEFMKKVVGKKSETGSVNAVTKEDFANLGKTIAESLTAGLESLKK